MGGYYRRLHSQNYQKAKQQSAAQGTQPSGWSSIGLVKALLALGFWVQGFRCFPWMGVNFFLKDGLKVAPSTLQILQYSSIIPMVGKPLYGIVSDAVAIRSMKRLPYIAIGAAFQAISWLLIVLLPPAFTSVPIISICLLTSNLGASFAEVANDAIVVEVGKRTNTALQSFAWMFGAFGGALGNLLGGMALDWISPKTIFFIFAIIASLQFLVTINASERCVQPGRKNASKDAVSIPKQISAVISVVQRPEIYYSIAWLATSYAVIPVLFGTMFYYQTHHLNLSSSVIGFSKVGTQVCVMAWSFSYSQWFKDVSPRTMLKFLQATIVVLVVLDLLFVRGFFEMMGISHSTYVVCAGLLEALFIMKLLPFSVLMAKLCPPGCEGSLMALVMSSVALSMIVSGFFGVALVSHLGISGDNFSSLPHAIIVEAACAAVPILWCSWIPASVVEKEDVEEEEEEEEVENIENGHLHSNGDLNSHEKQM